MNDRFTLLDLGGYDPEALARDVRQGLTATPKRLPPKYFYDEVGSRLFERICDTPEYYLTRSEQTILDRRAREWVAAIRPVDVVELGSGSGRKTRAILGAALDASPTGRVRYLPLDRDVAMMRASAASLLDEFPNLTVCALVGDFERLPRLPSGGRRLVLFLGSTIGNLDDAGAIELFRSLARELGPDDRLLVGFDLVKDEGVLHRAYNDAAGVTAAFNRNVLAVINRELDADFDLDAFEHVAFYDRERSRIEMHLEARRAHEARVRKLGLVASFALGERIHTENSHKFTRTKVEALLRPAGLAVARWETDDDRFGLALIHGAGGGA